MSAFGPITATRRTAAASIGRTGPAPAWQRLVAQQHRAGDRRTPGEHTFVRVVDRLLGPVGGALVGAHAVGEHEQVAHEPVDLCLVDVTPLDRSHQLVAVDAHRTGHLQVEAGVRRRRCLVDAVPVGHDEAVEAPLVAQDLGEEPSVLRGVFTGDLVVRAHDRPTRPLP